MPRLGVLLLLSASIVHSNASPRPIALDDYYRVETASSPAISPDGRWVVFVRNTIAEGLNLRHGEIWISPSDGSAPAVSLTGRDFFDVSAPHWSPDGKLLAFRSKVSGTEGNFWFLRMDGARDKLFQMAGVNGAPIFSPDNRWIAFTKKAYPTLPPARSRELSPLERQLEQRFKGRMYDWMNVRSDGRGYLPDPRDPAATPPSELYVVPREGGAPKQLTHLGVDVLAPVWRPDSGALVLVIRYPGNYHGGWPPWDMVHRFDQELRWFNQYVPGA